MPIKSTVWNILKSLSSVRFSIILFLCLAFVSLFGTIIEQDENLGYYQSNYPEDRPIFWIITWKVIVQFGLNHLYSSYWFLFLLLLFFFSLFICTLSTQLPIFKHARRWSFLYKQKSLEKKMFYHNFAYTSLVNSIYILNLSNYYVFHRGKAVYSYKGLLGRIAPIFVHFSIIITLIGSLIGFTGGLIVQEMIPSGEIFHIQNIIKAGQLNVIPFNILCKVNDFFLTFNNDNSIQQFFSNISVIDHRGSLLFNKSIAVNAPLNFNGLTFYQTDWKVNALRIQIGSNNYLSKTVQKMSLQFTDHSVLVCNFKLDELHKIFVVIPDLNDNILIYDLNGILLTSTRYGVWNIIYGVPIIFNSLIVSTGLQIKFDPGLYIAYLGFLILIVSIILSYMSYSQIWINKDNKKLHVSGKTNRAILSFEDEMIDIYKRYINLVNLN